MNVSSLEPWDVRFLELAWFIGRWSKDQSRKVGCVIVAPDKSIRAIGYNGFPRGVDDADELRNARPAKYLWTEHAERNAIYQAARNGITLSGSTMYVPWFPCIDCARAIIQVDISRLVAIRPAAQDPRWDEHFLVAEALFKEANVSVVLVPEAFSQLAAVDLTSK